jgi:hypothetical protein
MKKKTLTIAIAILFFASCALFVTTSFLSTGTSHANPSAHCMSTPGDWTPGAWTPGAWTPGAWTPGADHTPDADHTPGAWGTPGAHGTPGAWGTPGADCLSGGTPPAGGGTTPPAGGDTTPVATPTV